MLPCEVRVTSVTHPLSGRLVAARSFKRLNGELLLVIELPDGSPGTIPAGATDVLGSAEAGGPAVVLDAGGWRRLRDAGMALGRAGDGGAGAGTRGVRWLRAGPGPRASGAGGRRSWRGLPGVGLLG